MAVFIQDYRNWPEFFWSSEKITSRLAAVRYRQGLLLGKLEGIKEGLKAEAQGRIMNTPASGSDNPGESKFIDTLLEAVAVYTDPLREETLFHWLGRIFPDLVAGRGAEVSGRYRAGIPEHRFAKEVAQRSPASGVKEKAHFQAPRQTAGQGSMESRMGQVVDWFNREKMLDPVLKAALVHLWILLIRPFDDGNFRIAAILTELQLRRADHSEYRFYNIISEMAKGKAVCDEILEKTTGIDQDLTGWLDWFLDCLDRAITAAGKSVKIVLVKSLFWERHSSVSFNERQRIMLNRILEETGHKLSSSGWARATKTSQDSAGRDIRELVDRGILIRESAGGRSTRYALVYDAEIEKI